MNLEKYTVENCENETIININLTQNDKIFFHKKEKSHLKTGEKICTIETVDGKFSVSSPNIGQITRIHNADTQLLKVILTLCKHEIEFNGMCADCGVDIR